MSKVLIIGAGGVGRVTTFKCAQHPDVFSGIMLASRTKSKCDVIAQDVRDQLGYQAIETAAVDAGNVPELVALIRSYEPELVIHVALPYQDLTIMDACLKTGVHYLDTANYEEDLSKVTVVSPDVGGVARARELAQRIGCALAIVDKRREKPGEVAEMTVIGEVKGQKCIIVDDICDTAGTLVKAADVLLDNGAKEVHAYITHGVLSGPAVERVTGSRMKSLVITDSIEPTAPVKNAANIRIVPTAPMFAQAILNIWNGTSVSSLFDPATLEPIYEGMYSAA